MFARITFFAIFAVALAADPLCQSPCQFGTSGPCRHTTGLCFPYPGAALHCDRGLVDCSGQPPALTFTGCLNCTAGEGPCYTPGGVCTDFHLGTLRCNEPAQICPTERVTIPAEYNLLYDGEISSNPSETFYQLRIQAGAVIENFPTYTPADCIDRCTRTAECTAVVMSNTRECTLLRTHNVADRSTTSSLTYSLQKIGTTSTAVPASSSDTTGVPTTGVPTTDAASTTPETATPSTTTKRTTSLPTIRTSTPVPSTTISTTSAEPSTRSPLPTTEPESTAEPTTTADATPRATTPRATTSTGMSGASTNTPDAASLPTTTATPATTTVRSLNSNRTAFETESGHSHEKTEGPLSEKDKRMLMGIVGACVGFLIVVLAIVGRRSMEDEKPPLRRLPPSLPVVDNNAFLLREGKPPYWQSTMPAPTSEAEPLVGAEERELTEEDIFRPSSEIPRDSPENLENMYADVSTMQNRELQNETYRPLYEDETPQDTPDQLHRFRPGFPRSAGPKDSPQITYPKYFTQAEIARPPSVSTPEQFQNRVAADAEFYRAATGFMGDDGVVDFRAMRETTDAASTSPDRW
eukprot:m.439469 g.439469  ORF g.439469 m.439469 type:complete len:580 (-) comp18395_c0_seq1:150-1889(-)